MIPTEVNCIIVGTGLTNSIISAACSRIGKSVLHVDGNSYYGNEWASFTFQQLLDWIKLRSPRNKHLEEVPEELTSKSRMFCIDLCPRLLYSNGPMVELLVKSNVARYHEFKNNIRLLSLVDDELHVIPCRRSDVFNSPLLSDLVDKRRLMKFIEMCIQYNSDPSEVESAECAIAKNLNKPINVFLEENGLKPALRQYLINSIAMVSPTVTTEEACKKIKQFVIATERFGRSPFIFPLYGCGEFPQSFCRLSAVFGGVYCLNTHLDNIKINSNDSKNNFLAKLSNNESEVKSDMLVLDMPSAIKLNLAEKQDVKKVSRAIVFTRKSILQNDENLISFLRIPASENNANLVYLLEFNSSVSVSPPDINIVYLWTISNSSCAETDLSSLVKRHLSESQIIWEVYFQHSSNQTDEFSEKATETEGVYITSPPIDDVDYEDSIKEAEAVFKRMYPNEEFLPRAPDPDEILSE